MKSVSLLTCILLVPLGCRSGPDATDDDLVLAAVGDQVVTAGELRQKILHRHYGRVSLLGVIRQLLFQEEARRLGIEISRADIDARVERDLAALFPADATHDERVNGLARRNLTEDSLRRELRFEAENALLMERVVKAQRTIEPADVEKLYQATFAEESVRVRHIALRDEKGDPAPANVESTAFRALEEIHRQLTQGADFALLARSRSANSETARRGGEIGWIHRGTLPDPEVSERIFALAVGVPSPPIRERDWGWHIFEVEERAPARPLREVEGELRGRLADMPPTLEEINCVEELLRSRSPVSIFSDRLPR